MQKRSKSLLKVIFFVCICTTSIAAAHCLPIRANKYTQIQIQIQIQMQIQIQIYSIHTSLVVEAKTENGHMLRPRMST